MAILVDEKFRAEERKVEEPDVAAAIEKVEGIITAIEEYAKDKRHLVECLRTSTPDYDEGLRDVPRIFDDIGNLEQLAADYERAGDELYEVVLKRRDEREADRKAGKPLRNSHDKLDRSKLTYVNR